MKISLTIPMLLVFLIFLVLKVNHVVDWSWMWVTSPLWLPFVLIGIFMVWFAGVFTLACMLGHVKVTTKKKR
jgi:hypothetical protein